MRSYNRIKSVAGSCLRSLKIRLHRSSRHTVLAVLCIVCALALSLPSLILSATAMTGFNTLSNKSIELNLNTEKSEAKVTLNGMMPHNAVATVTDVTGDYPDSAKSADSPAGTSSVIAAYDITITDGGKEYQPGEKAPIYVEIAHPKINSEAETQLWHIMDNGTREEITDYTIEDGKLSFYATGFSIYEIVEISNGGLGGELAKTVAEFTEPNGASFGFNLYYDNNNHKYFTSAVNSKNALVEDTSIAQAATWFFEEDGNYLKLYTHVNGVKKYLHTKSGNEIELSETAADLLEISPTPTAPRSYYFKKAGEDKWLQHSNGGGGIRYYTDNNNPTNSKIFVVHASPEGIDLDALDILTQKPYGLLHYSDGTTVGNALMAAGDTHSLIKLVLTAEGNNRILYVDENDEIDQWRFIYDPSNEKFTISVNTPSGTQYLCADSSGVSTTSDPASASKFNVSISSEHRVQLKSNDYYVTFQPRAQDQGGSRFNVTTDPSDPFTWLYLLDRASMDNGDYITFSADRVSASDVPDGQKVIVYVRIWNEDELRYDIYAVDRDGSLYPCYASGGKIMWLGDSTGSLEWEFTEYVDQVTKQPNYYYELYNPYSEKYLAPQLAGNQVLSDTPIGINIPGRRDGEFYSNVIAWDNTRYAYIGLRPNADKTALEPCSESTALPFYFATLEELNLSDRLHEVPTLDNNQYGITMKMIDFGTQEGQVNDLGSTVTWDYFGGKTGGSVGKLKTGLLTSYLDENGYPIATPSNRNFGEAYAGAIPVNHLFLERVYESSGYFEFDSTQNFATLKKYNDDGTVSLNEQENGETDFILYHELGTHDRVSTANSLKHGQFYPYDTILPGVYAEKNPQNLYSSLTSPSVDIGRLDDKDPRKYEQLHLIQTEESTPANYYFGMEMEASFVQTPSGLDAWGHDIIFEFTGDDDFWLYVDGQLVLDLGGIHSAVMGTINFRTGDVYFDKNGTSIHGTMGHSTLREIFTNNYTAQHPGATQAEINEYLSEYFNEGENIFKDYSTHTMKMFYMERGANASNLHMRFNIASVTPGNVVVSKEVSGEGADELDSDFLEYPFQIYYTLPEGPNGEPGEEHLLGNDDEHVRVTYQNSNNPVTYVRKYRPPGFTEEQAYDNIYFINPTRNAEIAFPDDTITYRIVECAVNTSVYGDVTINGEEVPPDRVEIRGDLRSYSSESGSASVRPRISFDNHVNNNVIKDLLVTKKLLDEDNNEVTDDPATFDFRLAIASYEVPADQIPLANMYNYYVLSPDKEICRFDYVTETFAETGIAYSRANIKSIQNGEVTGVSVDDVTFKTSGFGSISGIPAGYTICVPGLPVNSVFRITENPKTGYGLMGYERVMGSKILEDHSVEEIPSYMEYGGNPLNVGKVIADENPQMEVHNRKGYGITANKEWSDLSITTGHSEIYTAVYVDGELLEGSVKQIKSPSLSANYFWTSLVPNSDGSARTSLEGYVIREVTISNPSPTVSADGTVTDCGTVTPLSSGNRVNVVASRTQAVTPEDEDPDRAYDYIVSYEQNELSNTSREDTIRNIREGGIAIRLFKWDTDIPLRSGQFTLVDSSGNTVGNYSSDENGLVTIMYDFEKNQTYTLTETAAPRGYVGLQENLCFKVKNDGTVSLFYEDGAEWGTKDDDDIRWANGKPGSDGLSAYVDVYNKQFNFKVVKMDSAETGAMLDNAHFALYKQTNTTIGGYEKNRDPLTGFEDMVTVDGELYICGGDSGRSLNPGSRGSVYFLTETQAPLNYTKLNDDIVFRVSPIGVPSMISDSYQGHLVETDDSYIYTLSVPNEKKSENKILTIRKVVSGNASDSEQEFAFDLDIDTPEPTDMYEWFKNGIAQSEEVYSGCTIYLKHNDTVEISVPQGSVVTLSEQSGSYTTTFTLDDAPPQETSSMTLTMADDKTLVVTNTFEHIVPTGVFDNTLFWWELVILPAGFAALFLWFRKKHYFTLFRR